MPILTRYCPIEAYELALLTWRIKGLVEGGSCKVRQDEYRLARYAKTRSVVTEQHDGSRDWLGIAYSSNSELCMGVSPGYGL